MTILGVAYVASFRVFRANLHQAIEDEKLRTFLSDPGKIKWFKQWNLFVVSFAVVDTVLIYRLAEKGHYPCTVGAILLVAMVLLLGAIWLKGRPEKKDE